VAKRDRRRTEEVYAPAVWLQPRLFRTQVRRRTPRLSRVRPTWPGCRCRRPPAPGRHRRHRHERVIPAL